MMVRVLSSHLDPQGVMLYKIIFPDGQTQDVTREFLHRPGNPEVCDLPSTTVEYRETSSLLSEEEIRQLANPPQLSPIQQEFLMMHNRLFHLPLTSQ
jgi:hypothetical protein